MSDYTREQADLIVEHLQEHDWGRSDVRVHWDDCNMSETRFWVYIKVPGVRELVVGDGDSPLVKDMSLQMRGVLRQFKKDQAELNNGIQFTLESSPKRISKVIRQQYKREFVGYDTDTWVYVMWTGA